MKKNIFVFSALLAFVAALVSCDHATSGITKGEVSGIYTVDRNFLYPELVDTFIRVNNIADFDLKTGDRAYVTVAYEYDNYYGQSLTEYNIKSVDEKITVNGLTALSDVDTDIYSSPIGWEPIIVSINPELVSAMWLWKNYKNLRVKYYGNGTKGDFKLSPVGLSGDTLCFALNARVEDGDEYMNEILSFDLSSVKDLLSAEDASKLASLDSISTKITLRWFYNRPDEIKVMSFAVGKYENYFKK